MTYLINTYTDMLAALLAIAFVGLVLHWEAECIRRRRVR